MLHDSLYPGWQQSCQQRRAGVPLSRLEQRRAVLCGSGFSRLESQARPFCPGREKGRLLARHQTTDPARGNIVRTFAAEAPPVARNLEDQPPARKLNRHRATRMLNLYESQVVGSRAEAQGPVN